MEIKIDEITEIIERVELPNGAFGMAMSIEETSVGLVLLGEDRLIKTGDEAKRTGRATA
jgi:F0F1-type ATP synthase alpha subunit